MFTLGIKLDPKHEPDGLILKMKNGKFLKLLVSSLASMALLGCGGDSKHQSIENPDTGSEDIQDKSAVIIHATASKGGTVTPTSLNVREGDQATFTISIDDGYYIAEVLGCEGQLVDGEYKIDTVKSSCNVDVIISPKQYLVRSKIIGTGSIYPNERILSHGETSTFDINPNIDSNLESITGCNGKLDKFKYTIDNIKAECTIVANFKKKTFTITSSSNTGGTVTPLTQNIILGDSASFDVEPLDGFIVSDISGCDGQLEGNKYTIKSVSSSCNVSVLFSPAEISISSRHNYGGEINPSTLTFKNNDGGSFLILTNEGFNIESVAGCNGSLDGHYFKLHPPYKNCELVVRFSNINYSEFDSDIENYLSENNINQGVIGIIKNEKLVYLNHYGANKEYYLVEQKYRLASVSKPLTLIAILDLVEKGKLNLEDKPFSENGILFNDYTTGPYYNLDKITIDHLLKHMSGWRNEPYDIMYSPYSIGIESIFNTMIHERPLATNPGESFYYLNFGYDILGRIIEKITQNTISDYLSNVVFKDVKNFDLSIGGSKFEELEANEVQYYSASGEDPYAMNLPRMAASGGLISNVRTLANVLIRVDRNSNVQDIPLGQNRNYYYLGNFNWYHFGSFSGTTALIARLDDNYSVIALMNGRNTNNPNQFDDLLKTVVSRYKSINWEDVDLLQTDALASK